MRPYQVKQQEGNSGFFRVGLGAILLVIISVVMVEGVFAQAEPLTVLEIDIKTKDIKKGGTDAIIMLGVLYEYSGGTQRQWVVRIPDEKGNDHEKGQVTPHRIQIPSSVPLLNQGIKAIYLLNRMNGKHPGWYVESVAVLGRDERGFCWLIADPRNKVNQWLVPGLKSTRVPVAFIPLLDQPKEERKESCLDRGTYPYPG